MYYINKAFEPKKEIVKEEPLEYSSPIYHNYPCRYNNTRLITDPNDKTKYYESVSKYKVIKSEKDTYFTVDNTNNRLDIIANNQYGNPSYWWVIAMANNIIDAFVKIPSGTILRIPYIGNLYVNGSVLKTGGYY